MFAPKPRHLLPAATLLATALFLASAVPHGAPASPTAASGTASPAAVLASTAPIGVLKAEIAACERTGRSHDECLDEAEGKALIQRAEFLSQSSTHGASRADELADEVNAAAPVRRARSRVQ